MRYAKRKDGNHPEIEAVFRQMLGDHVTDTSAWGDGAGDLFISWGAFPGCFIEIKRDGKAEYTAHQIRFQKDHPLAVRRCDSTDQAIRICKEIRALARDIAFNKMLDLGAA